MDQEVTGAEEDEQSTWPVKQRDHAPAELIAKKIRYQLRILQPDGRWMEFGMPQDSRDRLTLIQAHRAREFPNEKQRVDQEVTMTVVSEIVGDGEGETSPAALFARNEEATKRLLKNDQQQ